jgi:hypothetical protein
MAFLDFLFGGKQHEKIKQIPTMSKEQQALFSQLLGGLSGPLGQGFGNLSQILSGDPEAFKAYEAPAMRQFNQEIVPGIAERFSSLGGGAQHSSAFGQQMGQAGAALSENLAAQRAGLQQNAMSQLAQLLGIGVGTPTQQTFYTPESRSYGLFGNMFGGAASGFGQGAGMYPFLKMLK